MQYEKWNIPVLGQWATVEFDDFSSVHVWASFMEVSGSECGIEGKGGQKRVRDTESHQAAAGGGAVEHFSSGGTLRLDSRKLGQVAESSP